MCVDKIPGFITLINIIFSSHATVAISSFSMDTMSIPYYKFYLFILTFNR